ncbi:DUF7344 domain-containing protein [Halorussus halophilus]|uniref:DUF7344 domain-containing protein n=1 Tax=Halorussus halophilus TaxID=2650975 RepID=UPI0013017BAB|nr:hypothetical protein [Halorussus halophilus]
MAKNDGATGGDAPADQSSDALHWALTDRQRVAAIAFLQNHDTATPSELADRIARQRDGDPKSLELSLTRHHLPVMADAGLVEYDEADESVTLAELSPDAREHVERALDEQ